MKQELLYNFLRDHRGLTFRSMEVFNYLLEAALLGGVMILLLLLVRKLFRRQLGNRVIYMAWLLVAIRLLVPLALPNPAMNELRPTLSSDEAARPVADQIRVRFQDAMYDVSRLMEGDIRHVPADQEPTLRKATAQLVSDIASTSYYGWTGKWFLLGYAAVAAGVGGWMLVCNARFRQTLKRQRVGELSGSMAEEYQALCRELKVRPVPVWLTDPLSGACLVGAWRPYIALPLTMKDDEIRLALRHELCHLKVWDHRWALVRNLCCVVQWFNPLVWIGAHCSRQDGELACDARVIRGMDAAQRRTYAELLLTSTARRSLPSLAVAATGMTATGRRLKQRMQSIMANRAVRRGAAMVFLAVGCAGLVLAFGTAETEKNLYDPNRASNDEAFGTAETLFADGNDSAGERLGMPETVTSAAEARAQAERYLAQPILGDASENWMAGMDWCVFPSATGWEVSATPYDGGQFCLRMDNSGRLLSWNGYYQLLGWNQDDVEISAVLIEGMENYAQQYVKRYLGGGEITEFKVTYRDAFYATAEMLLDGMPCSMVVQDPLKDDVKICSFRQAHLEERTQTQREAFELMHSYLVEELGIFPHEADSDLHRVKWDEDFCCMIGTVSAQAYWMSEEARTRLEKISGPQERYTLRMVIDPNGKGVKSTEFVPRQTYPDKTALESRVAKTNMDTMEVIDGKYLVQAGAIPAGTPYDILETVRFADSGFLSCSGTANLASLTLIRYKSFLGERDQWVSMALIERDESCELSLKEVACQLNGQDITAVCVQMGDVSPAFFGKDLPATATVTEADALGIALRVSREYWWNKIPVEELTRFPVEIGHRLDAACWEVTFHDPLCGNRIYRVSIDSTTGEVMDVYDPTSGNG